MNTGESLQSKKSVNPFESENPNFSVMKKMIAAAALEKTRSEARVLLKFEVKWFFFSMKKALFFYWN